jgi:DNA-directed RNA polymerase specialized sigma24 family protein
MPRADREGSGEALFLFQLSVIERVISFVSSRHHLPGSDADDFGSHVKLKLIENDYAILKKFEGRSNLRTYLTVVIQRLFLDYRIMAWGKWRPSAEAKRFGEIAILLERLTHRDGYGFEEACELMQTNHQITMSRPDLEAIAARLPHRLRRRFESEDALTNLADDQPSPDEIATSREQAMRTRLRRWKSCEVQLFPWTGRRRRAKLCRRARLCDKGSRSGVRRPAAS